MRKGIIVVGLVASLTATNAQMIFATPSSQSKLSSANSTISSIEQQKSALQSQIDSLDSELVETLANIDIVQDEITDKKAELDKANTDLAAAKEKEQEQYDAMKKRITYMYENGDSSFLESLLESDGFADVLNKIEYFSQVYSSDRDMLTEYQNTKAKVETLVSQVQDEKDELEETQDSYKEEKANLVKMVASKKSKMSNFNSQLSSAKKLAAQYKALAEEENAAISGTVSSSSSVTAGASNVSSGSSSSSSDSGSSDSGSTSKSGSAVASYACQFVGNPYVWGGTSLTNGCDCSGFVMSVYAHFGKSLPHSSSALRSVGSAVSPSDIQPGDIVCYAGHVAIYIGGGRIVHASNHKDGIKISSPYNYRTVVAIRRIF